MGKRRIPRVDPPQIHTLQGSFVAETLDLHGMSASAAEQRLEMFFQRVSVTAPGSVVRVITGKGTRSRGEPVLRAVLLEALSGWLRRFVDEWSLDQGGGAYLIRLRR
ncbi:MAG: Smr/MutS family protein [Gemmatimonadota bacterium]